MPSTGLTIRPSGELDFLSLGAVVHRLDPGVIPFRKATQCAIHVSGGEFNVAANLADCFRLSSNPTSSIRGGTTACWHFVETQDCVSI